MNILFVHQNFPGQYLHLARHLAAQPGRRVLALSQRQDGDLPGGGARSATGRSGASPRICITT